MRKRTADCLFVRQVLVLDCKQNQTKKLQFIQLLVVTEEKNVKEKTRMDRFRGDRGKEHEGEDSDGSFSW